MSDAAWPLQQAVYTALSGAGLGVSVYDDVPEGTDPPYVQVGDMDGEDFSAGLTPAEDTRIYVDVWSRYDGRKEVRTLLAAVKAALHEQQLSCGDGIALVLLRWEASHDFLEPDGRTRHGVARFRAVTVTN